MVLNGVTKLPEESSSSLADQAMCHSPPSPSPGPFDLYHVSKSHHFLCFYGHVVKIFTCLLFPPFSFPLVCTDSDTLDRLPLLAALFCLSPFTLCACILPCVCFANISFCNSWAFSSVSPQRDSWQMSAFRRSKKKPESKSIQPYTLHVQSRIVFSLIQPYIVSHK